jgi:hypothetical protein
VRNTPHRPDVLSGVQVRVSETIVEILTALACGASVAPLRMTLHMMSYNEINPSSIPRLTASVRLDIPSLAYKDER